MRAWRSGERLYSRTPATSHGTGCCSQNFVLCFLPLHESEKRRRRTKGESASVTKTRCQERQAGPPG